MAVGNAPQLGILQHLKSGVPLRFQIPPVKMDIRVKQHIQDVLEPMLTSKTNQSDHTIQSSLFLHDLLSSLATPPPVTSVRINTLKYSTGDVVDKLTRILKEKYQHRACPAPPILSHTVLNDVLVIPTQFSVGGVSPAQKEVIVGVQCAEAVLRGADVFALGVMATPKDIKVGDLVAVFADVNGECCKGKCDRFEGERVFVGNGRFVMERLEVFKRDPSTIRGVAVEMTHPLVDCPSLSAEDLQDLGLLQNIPSIVTSHVLDPQPGEAVLDMCAAPGGKTTHIASLMKNKGCVIALDKSPPKISKLTENVQRFGLSNVHCYQYNSTKCLSKNVTSDDSKPLPHAPPFLPETFDRILLDGPCSALGQRPQMKCPLSLVELKSFQGFQRKFISQAVPLLKPGGVLVYSTCTFTPQENECQVEWLLSNYAVMELVAQEPYLGRSGWHGYNLHDIHKVQRFGPSLSPSMEGDPLSECTPRTPPVEGALEEICTDTIGFFIAKFRKNLC